MTRVLYNAPRKPLKLAKNALSLVEGTIYVPSLINK